jgi:flagellar motor protein MotB
MPIKAPKGFVDETDPKVCQVGHPAPPWMVNYADLMSELVCFFIVLYALSAALNKSVQNAKSEVEDLIKNDKVKGEVKMDKEGLKISLEERGLVPFFQSGSADATAEMEDKVAQLAPILKKLAEKQDIIVEGHTDNQRIHNEYFDSNWELSTARATSVARLLVDKHGLPPEHLGAIGYGEFRPEVPNDTPEHRSKNRRVVFFVKMGSSGPAAGAGPPAATAPAATAGATAAPPVAGGETPAPTATGAPDAPPAAADAGTAAPGASAPPAGAPPEGGQ